MHSQIAFKKPIYCLFYSLNDTWLFYLYVICFSSSGMYRDGDGQYHWVDGQVTNVGQGFWALDQPLGFQQGKDPVRPTNKDPIFVCLSACECFLYCSQENSRPIYILFLQLNRRC